MADHHQNTDPVELDARGMRCPMPVLRLRRLLDDTPGRPIKIYADDPVAARDIPAFCGQIGAEITDRGRNEDSFWFVVISA